ncbi:hypothetical protein [Dactylosporangium sp. CA-092794]|uniref:hypothetical protein n=1 Tax=Dactylosporangium sp. CA-092794 TaxID=3239929 RepID=UPI003D92C94F
MSIAICIEPRKGGQATLKAQAIREFLIIGSKSRYLVDVTTEHPVFGNKHVLDTIITFISACKESGLLLTAESAREQYGDLISKWTGIDEHDRGEVNLTVHDVALVREAAYHVQTVMLSESSAVFAYVAQDKRFPVPRLLANVGSLMAPGIFDTLPPVAQYDFGEAGRCIVFETPTAAAFHTMRATEDVLKYFYCKLVRTRRVRQLMWGPMVESLSKRRKPPPAVLLESLTHLRKGFRNPTQHPEKIYTVEEAQDLFALSIEAVNRMVSYLRSEKRI